jgi:hypothetical protein
MIKRIVKSSIPNLFQAGLGVGLFFLSFHIGESTIIGGICHLSGCAIFCGSIHNIHDLYNHQ